MVQENRANIPKKKKKNQLGWYSTKSLGQLVNYFEKQNTICFCNSLSSVTITCLCNREKQISSFKIIRFHNRISNVIAIPCLSAVFKAYGILPQNIGSPGHIHIKVRLRCEILSKELSEDELVLLYLWVKSDLYYKSFSPGDTNLGSQDMAFAIFSQ